MHEIDLIPPNYYDMQRVRRWIKFLVLCTIAIAVLTGLTKVTLAVLIDYQNEELKKLQQTKISIVSKKKLLDSLMKQKASLEYKLKTLDDLRNGPTTNRLFKAIDNAMSDDIWFQELNYRNSPVSNDKDDKTINTGYFIIVPQEKNKDVNDNTREPIVQEILTRIEIKGQARNHTELAAFVNRLNKQPELKTVKIINTHLRRYTAIEIIDFTLLATTKALQQQTS